MKPLSERHREQLLNRAATEVQADALACVLGMPCHVVFDGEYNHLTAADQLDAFWANELATGEANIVYTAIPLTPEELADVDRLAAYVQEQLASIAIVERVMERAA